VLGGPRPPNVELMRHITPSSPDGSQAIYLLLGLDTRELLLRLHQELVRRVLFHFGLQEVTGCVQLSASSAITAPRASEGVLTVGYYISGFDECRHRVTVTCCGAAHTAEYCVRLSLWPSKHILDVLGMMFVVRRLTSICSGVGKPSLRAVSSGILLISSRVLRLW